MGDGKVTGNLYAVEGTYKTYETLPDGKKVVCGAYQDEDGDIFKGCSATRADGSGVPPGNYDMRMFWPEKGSPYRSMVATGEPVERSKLQLGLAPPDFAAAAKRSRANLRMDYLHHRMKEAAIAYQSLIRLGKNKATQRIWGLRYGMSYEEGLKVVPERLTAAEDAYEKAGGTVNRARNRR